MQTLTFNALEWTGIRFSISQSAMFSGLMLAQLAPGSGDARARQ